MRICFVALEILGPFTGGGIATALAGQAEHHAAAHDVTVLYVHPDLSAEDGEKWRLFYAERGIRFIRAQFDTFYVQDNLPKRSFAVKEYLEAWDENFDVILFHEYLGLGYYTALSRQLGLNFQHTHIGTVIHGPSEWARPLNLVTEYPRDLPLYEMERKQAEYSDFVVAPSDHILDWCREQGWALPADSRAISNLLPHRVDAHTGLTQGAQVTRIEEVVFFGRLEVRKGFFTFLDAISYLHKNDLTLPRKVSFLGALCTNSDRNSASTVLEYAENWRCDVQLLNNFDHERAIRYLVDRRPLTVVPSMDESFGLTAYECLSFGVPTLIADRGALKTLPAPPERDAVLVEPRANLLGQRIAAALSDGHPIAAVDPLHVEAPRAWDALLADLAGTPARPVDPWGRTVQIDALTAQASGATPLPQVKPDQLDRAPKVSVILVHHNRPETLRPALESLLVQTYENIEIVIVDDGSQSAKYAAVEALVSGCADPRILLVRQENKYLGAARNFGVSQSSGAYLMFMDDDNVALPHEVETFVTVATRSGADVLNTPSRLFRSAGEDRIHYDLYLPVGPSLQLALLSNTFGDANALVRRETFEMVGGFTEEYAVGCEDYEFFTRAFLAGARMQLVPEIIFDYRADDDSMMNELNSGKYIINQTRGVRALMTSHRHVDLTQLRGLMRIGFFSGIEEEYGYWTQQNTDRRRHGALEDELAQFRHRPNSAGAAKVVVKLLVAHGQVREAIAFMERNAIVPEEHMLRQMQSMLAKYERRGVNAGVQPNILVNGAFEFWDLGARHEGVAPYSAIANGWLMPSSKRRGTLIASQERDNALFGLSRSRVAYFLRLDLGAADPGGYCNLCQRMTDLGRLLENEVELTGLVRSSSPGPFDCFIRVAYTHGTEDFHDVWPEKSHWTSVEWQMITCRFDLTGFSLDKVTDRTVITLFIGVPKEDPQRLDIADLVLLPYGEAGALAPYLRENERSRAQRSLFSTGKDGRCRPLGRRNMRMDLPAAARGRMNDFVYMDVRSSVVLALNDGSFLELNVTEANWRSADEAAGTDGYVHLVVDRDVDQPGVAMKDFLVVLGGVVH
ncbi:MAG: glycosyltransferase [Pseudomonadota bacterium]